MIKLAGRVALLAVILAVVSGCVRFTPPPLDEPPVVLDRLLFCVSVQPKYGWAEPVEEKAVFVKGRDAAVSAFLALRALRGAHTLSWKWYAPSQAIYRAADKIAVGEDGKAFERYIAWDTIFVSDDKEPGTWTVAVFLDETLLVNGRFEIKPIRLPGLCSPHLLRE